MAAAIAATRKRFFIMQDSCMLFIVIAITFCVVKQKIMCIYKHLQGQVNLFTKTIFKNAL
jgi:hypothetical protein